MSCKYEGLILEGRWKYKNTVYKSCYLFENIFNQNTIKLSYTQVEMVISGKNTIGHIQTRRAPNSENFIYGNNVQKKWKQTKHKYSKNYKKV